jgi:hypothetical protein
MILLKLVEGSRKNRRELAEEWGVNHSDISKWINKGVVPRRETQEVVASSFGRDVAHVFPSTVGLESIASARAEIADQIKRAWPSVRPFGSLLPLSCEQCNRSFDSDALSMEQRGELEAFYCGEIEKQIAALSDAVAERDAAILRAETAEAALRELMALRQPTVARRDMASEVLKARAAQQPLVPIAQGLTPPDQPKEKKRG